MRIPALCGLLVLGAGCSGDQPPEPGLRSAAPEQQVYEMPSGERYRVTLPTGQSNDRNTFSFELLSDDSPTAESSAVESPVLPASNVRISAASRRAAERLVDRLSFDRFKRRISTLSDFGYRGEGTESFNDAARWLVDALTVAGYTVEYHGYTFRTVARQNIYVTKRGTESPDSMYIVSAHLDGFLFPRDRDPQIKGGAADDDGSGVALVLEAALVFAPADVETATSIRFVFWNNEETGLAGSRAYVSDRAELQGQELPPGSGLYPEPTWLGMIQHDMVLFDHGFPPRADQRQAADLDIEFRGGMLIAERSQALAMHWQASNAMYSNDYPAEVGDDMRGTDSISFRYEVPAISIRENKRAELEAGWNPNWHQPSDVYASYSEEDFRLGFNALQMSVGAVAELAGATLNAGR